MEKGFTLIELLVVVSIIAILSAVALPQYNKALEKSRGSEAIQLLSDVAKAERIYRMTYNSYTCNLKRLDIKMPGLKSDSSFGTTNFKFNADTCSSNAFKMTASRGQWSGSNFQALSSPKNYSVIVNVDGDGCMTMRCTGGGKNICQAIANGNTDGWIKQCQAAAVGS